MSIAVENLSFTYGDRTIFEQVNLTLEQGKMLSILGPNGAGKTTLLNTIAGMFSPTEGDIFYDGQSQKKMSPRELSLIIGYVPQTLVPAFDYSVLEYVVTGCAPRIGTFDRPKQEHLDLAMQAIETMGIAHLAEKSYMRISGGERQQVSIARVLAQRPQFILMDEPTAHLDFGNQLRVLKIIRSLSDEGYGVVFTTHNPDHVLLLGGQVAILNRQGRLVDGAVEDLINEKNLTELYGAELRLTQPEEAGRKICFSPGL